MPPWRPLKAGNRFPALSRPRCEFDFAVSIWSVLLNVDVMLAAIVYPQVSRALETNPEAGGTLPSRYQWSLGDGLVAA